MKFLLLPVTVIFITLSSFTSNTTTVEVEEDVAFVNCLQAALDGSRAYCRQVGCTFEQENEESRRLYARCNANQQ